MLSKQEAQALLAIISRPSTTIGAHEATHVVVLQQRLGAIIRAHDTPAPPTAPDDPKVPAPDAAGTDAA